MSGIVGILRVDGGPVDGELLAKMTAALAFRGPDAQATWRDGPIGLGHALLRTTDDGEEVQPAALDSRIWLVADARIDGRGVLFRQLSEAGRTVSRDSSDAMLILHAYDVWGEGCVDRLVGDFAFALWDAPRRVLFCARDHIGIKPFYYAVADGALLFSNTLNVLRLHPALTSELNELAVADFLLFNYNIEPDTTIFADIRQLAPAHTLTVVDGELRTRRYWTMPVEEPLYYRDQDDYVARFRELFAQAVSDRLRVDRGVIFMSGGLDSTSVAATMRSLPAGGQESLNLQAFTLSSASGGEEGDLAVRTAARLDIPITLLDSGHTPYFTGWDSPALHTPEPHNRPDYLGLYRSYQRAATYGRVMWTGYGGDPALYPSAGHFLGLARRGRFGRMVADAHRYRRDTGRFPPLYVRSRLRRRLGLIETEWPLPSWLDRALAQRLDLMTRQTRYWSAGMDVHPTRPEAYADLTAAYWPHKFVNMDPGVTGLALEARHPFFDIRLLAYLLRVPPVPWFVHKHLLRTATRGLLPEAVVTRPKVGSARQSVEWPARDEIMGWAQELEQVPQLLQWIDVAQYRRLADDPLDPTGFDSVFRPPCLAKWLWQGGQHDTILLQTETVRWPL